MLTSRALYSSDTTEVSGLTAPFPEILAMRVNLIAMSPIHALKGARQASVLPTADRVATLLLELLLAVLALGLLVPVSR